MSRLFRALLLVAALIAPAVSAGHVTFAHAGTGSTTVAKARPKIQRSTTLWT